MLLPPNSHWRRACRVLRPFPRYRGNFTQAFISKPTKSLIRVFADASFFPKTGEAAFRSDVWWNADCRKMGATPDMIVITTVAGIRFPPARNSPEAHRR
jgi:hypothetical protein